MFEFTIGFVERRLVVNFSLSIYYHFDVRWSSTTLGRNSFNLLVKRLQAEPRPSWLLNWKGGNQRGLLSLPYLEGVLKQP